MGIVGWIVLGLIAGLLANALLPGRFPGGWAGTVLGGIAGALFGGVIWSALTGRGILGLDLVSILIATGGAVLVLLLIGAFGRRPTPH